MLQRRTAFYVSNLLIHHHSAVKTHTNGTLPIPYSTPSALRFKLEIEKVMVTCTVRIVLF